MNAEERDGRGDRPARSVLGQCAAVSTGAAPHKTCGPDFVVERLTTANYRSRATPHGDHTASLNNA